MRAMWCSPRLPDLAGSQVLDRRRAMGQQVPVITMSATPGPVDLSAHYAVVGHLVKPCDIDELLQVVAFAIAT